ncbi:MAG: hypothetical protein Q4A41_05530, partial [Bacillota bacterium]|nr:hypothetical protein [Bacillota bacterium]
MNAWCGSASRGVKKSGRLRHRLSVFILLLSASLFVFSGCTDSRKTDAAYRACMEEMNHIIAEAPLSDDVGAEAFGGAKINQIVIMKAGSEITDEITITGYFLEQKYPNYSGIVQMAKMFVDEHPHVKIIFDNYEDDTAYTEAYPVMLMSENYGDIVLLPYHTKMSYLQESKFVDLMKYIEDEAKFDPDKYFMNLVLAERNVNGALLAFPTRFFSEAEFIFLKPLSEEFAARFENDPDLTIRDLLDFYLAKKEEMGPNWDMHFHEYFNPVWLITFNFNSLVDFK